MHPSFFNAVNLKARLKHNIIGDVINSQQILDAVTSTEPEIVFHLAAQALVSVGYEDPIKTYQTNIMGTVNLLEAVRNTKSVKVVIVITSDKCYENKEWIWPYRETDSLGGHDPYSSSKACAEIISSSYKRALLNHEVALATARAGNVIGGGDWARDRLVPDCIRAFTSNKPVKLRNPNALRPWQHVFEPISGYLILAERLYSDGDKYGGPWNFGPSLDRGDATVYEVALIVAEEWEGAHVVKAEAYDDIFHEAKILRLDNTKAVTYLNWKPKWSLKKAIKETVGWYKAFYSGKNMMEFSINQILDYINS